MNTINKTLASYILPCLTVLAMVGCQKQGFSISGTISEAKDSVLYLENMSLDGPVTIDSVRLDSDGEFSFSGERPEAPEFYRLRISSGIINLSVDSTENIEVKASYPTMSTQYEVKGSENCEKIKELSPLQQQLLSQVLLVSDNPTLGVQQTVDSIRTLIDTYKNNVRTNYIFKEPQKAYAYFALFQSLTTLRLCVAKTSITSLLRA